MDLRKIEEAKIECARKFFSKITSDQVKYDVVDSYLRCHPHWFTAPILPLMMEASRPVA